MFTNFSQLQVMPVNGIGRRGWVRKADVRLPEGKYQMTRPQDFYKDLGEQHGAPSLPLGKPLPPDTIVHVQKEASGWSLIATPEHKIGYLFLAGCGAELTLTSEYRIELCMPE